VRFHETFWAVTAGVAPIIALASVVSLTEARRTTDEMFRLLLEQPLDETADYEIIGDLDQRLGVLTRLYFAQLLNIFLQAALLAVGLSSLAYQASVVPPLTAVIAAVVGVVILAVHAVRVPEMTAYKAHRLFMKQYPDFVTVSVREALRNSVRARLPKRRRPPDVADDDRTEPHTESEQPKAEADPAS